MSYPEEMGEGTESGGTCQAEPRKMSAAAEEAAAASAAKVLMNILLVTCVKAVLGKQRDERVKSCQKGNS